MLSSAYCYRWVVCISVFCLLTHNQYTLFIQTHVTTNFSIEVFLSIYHLYKSSHIAMKEFFFM